MSIFFYPDGIGKINDTETFIQFYRQVYYYRSKDLKLEHRIDEILRNDALTRKDVVDILRWKIDALDYDDTYPKETVRNQWRSIDVGRLLDRLKIERAQQRVNKRQLLRQQGGRTEMFRFLCGQDGIGPVYAITLLYFLTKGYYPIYDKFAHIAVKVICACEKDARFDYLFDEKDLNREIHLNSGQVLAEYKEHYVDRLRHIFHGRSETDRDVDRALWAYGHLFNKTKSRTGQ